MLATCNRVWDYFTFSRYGFHFYYTAASKWPSVHKSSNILLVIVCMIDIDEAKYRQRITFLKQLPQPRDGTNHFWVTYTKVMELV